jgi:hypothetical protein
LHGVGAVQGAEGDTPSATPPPAADDAAARTGLFTVADLGGWQQLTSDVFQKGGAYDRALATARAKRDAR